MNILILGSGGREHSLAWAVKQNPKCDTLYCSPGNAGISKIAQCIDLNIENSSEIIKFCIDNDIYFVIIGPEAPLAMGIADDLRARNILTFGPSASAAKLESSKAFTKSVCDACNAPTAEYARFTELEPALNYVNEKGAPIVVKADGLAGGKGVIVAMTLEEALNGLKDIFSGAFGKAGSEVVIEEFMEGEEASFIVICDGSTILPLDSSQDHKRLLDNDAGPNTGGMGAYSPAPIVTDEVNKKIMDQVIIPTIEGMKKEGIEFSGFLYAGIIVDPNKNIKTLEFNCRMGDPETQPLLFRMQGDLFTVLFKAAKQELEGVEINWDKEHAITIVMASKDYPKKPILGDEINLPDIQDDSTFIFHAGTNLENSKIMTSGGRVLGVTAKGKTLEIAKNRAYDVLKKVEFNGAQFRTDIGKKALN